MKVAEMKLRSVPYGTIFRVFGDEFVALDYVDGGVLAIRKEAWKDTAFDENGVNDLHKASIVQVLGNYLNTLEKGGAAPTDIVDMTVDLKAVDGTREYGYLKVRAGLLTLEQYGKYQHIIPGTEEYWWLATPWRTPGEKSGTATLAVLVSFNGYWGYNRCSNTGGYLRPTLVFSSELLVFVEDGKEEDVYKAYLDYVENWANGSCKMGDSPMSYEEWKAGRKA